LAVENLKGTNERMRVLKILEEENCQYPKILRKEKPEDSLKLGKF